MRKLPMTDNKHIYYCQINVGEELALSDKYDLETVAIIHILKCKFIQNKGNLSELEAYKYTNAFDEKTQQKVLKIYNDFDLKKEWKIIVKNIITKSNKASQSSMKRGFEKVANGVSNDTSNGVSNDVSNVVSKVKDKVKDKDKEYSERFTKVWDYYQVEQKGDKNKALKSWIKIKGESLDGVELKKVLDYEMSKKFGVRHLVTLLNNYQSSVEAINENPQIEDDKEISRGW